MHFSYLVTADIPQVSPDPIKDIMVESEIKRLQSERESKEKDHIMIDIYLKELFGLRNPFARKVYDEIGSIMEPYSEQTEDPDYLQFEDYTEELRKEYETGTVDCIKLPEGRKVSVGSREVFDKFIIGKDGKVYQKYFGQLKHPKRSKRAKKMVAYRDYPYKKLYKTFDDFATKEKYFDYNEEYKGYGYLYNPDAFWDWYQIGGRWPKMFLVKDTCEEYSIGERSWCNESKKYEAPEGYMWVAAARKKDIEWQAHFDWNLKKKTEFYNELLECFQKGECPKDWYAEVTQDGIKSWGEMLYIKGETLEEFLKRYKVTEDYPYQIFPYGYLHEYDYVTEESVVMEDGKYKAIEDEDWYQKVKALFDDSDDEKVFVGVDCHI